MVTKMSVYHCNNQTYRGQKIMEDNWMGEERRVQIFDDEVIAMRKTLFHYHTFKYSCFLSLKQVI